MKYVISTAVLATMICVAGQSVAQDFTPKTTGTFIVAGRVTDIAPDASGGINTAAGAATGLQVDVKADVMPTLGFTYFLNEHVAVEAILGTTKHVISAVGPGGALAVHDTWVLPRCDPAVPFPSEGAGQSLCRRWAERDGVLWWQRS